MLRAGVSTASFFRRTAVENCFAALHRIGADLTEVFLGTYSEYEYKFAEMLYDRKGSIRVHSVHSLSTQFEPQLFSESDRVRRDAEIFFRKVCDAGHLLGAQYYTFHGPVCLKKRVYDFDYARLAGVMRHLDDIAGEYGMCTAYENVHWAYGAAPEYFAAMRAQYPEMHFTLDSKQAVLAGYDPVDFADAMGKQIVTLHLCDVDENGNTALPGKGKIDFAKLLSRVRDEGVDAAVLVEAYSGDYRGEAELADAYRLVERWVDDL